MMVRGQRGLTEVALMLVLATLALAWGGYEAHRARAAEEHARGAASGAVFASWMQAAHRRAQEEEAAYRAALVGDLGVAISIGGDLQAGGFAPAWLVTETTLGQRIELGVVDDGAGVPMAFAVAAPGRALSQPALEGFVAGAAEAGVVGIEALGSELGAETFSAGRRAAIEDAIGRILGAGDLVAVADLAIAYDDRVLHRRAQPGRPYLSEMRTDLEFADPDGAGPLPAVGMRIERDALTGEGGGVTASEMEVSGPATPPAAAAFVVGRAVGDPEFDADGDGVVGVDVSGDVLADAAGGEATLEATVVHGHRALRLAGLDGGRWLIDGALDAGRARGRQALVAGRIDAGAALDGGPVLAVEGTLEARGTVTAREVAASTAGTGSTGSGEIVATTQVRGDNMVASELRLTGTLTVSGACYGCAL